MPFSRIVLDGVGKRYGRVHALRGIDTSFDAGEVVALLGENGAGKSTLVGLLATTLRPTQGRISFGDIDQAEAARSQRHAIGLVAHASLVYPELSGRENLRFFGRLYGVDDPQRIDELLEAVGLVDAAARPAGTYSRGMLQRLALARALLHGPRLVLLDEPFTGLDVAGTEALRQMVRRLRDEGRIVVLVTHDLEAAGDLADRVVVLRRGRIARDVRAGRPLTAAELRGVYLGGEAPPAEEREPREHGGLSEAREPPSLWRAAAAVLGKDLLVELRSKEIVYTMVFFAVTVALVFSFAFVKEGRAPTDVGSGILWVAVTFSGTLGIGRVFDREGETLRGLLLTPAPRTALLVGKTLGIAALVLAVDVVLVPTIALLFQAPLDARPLELAALLVLGAIGFSVVGALIATASGRTRARGVLLPVLLYPIIVPLVIAGVKGTAALLEAPLDLDSAHYWIRFLAVFDACFLVLSLWIFEPVTAEG